MKIQPSLFGEFEKQHTILPDADVLYLPGWFSTQANSRTFFKKLKKDISWEQSEIMLYGKMMKIPRLSAWYGDADSSYAYLGTEFKPLSWLPLLLDIKQAVERVLFQHLKGTLFNSALINCYRDGQDSVAWHSDDEPELGKNPAIASLSFGAEREFQLKHRYNKQYGIHRLILGDGDLLFMYGAMQHHWYHQIPKSKKDVGERINITFRHVYPKNFSFL
ncbi:hypothetical protein AB835_05555 [Candidatus Endobugula sertula]|uniref:Fe2OG dioxygenase domain-containing protein n=1 Tax=Candidatus Endobugula sertula TaxID=62101 RepID=A0A1D2QR76_9GAMM|nr:hypothetical protein AB835_05555 [Candidatus Endobugula sertula]